jgi:hypothetical protein
MGIASYSGASSVIKPGVVTSSTRPSSPFVGQLIFETDTARLAAYNGSAWVTQNGGLVRVGGGTLSGTSTAFTNVFSSTYHAYKIAITDATFSGNSYANMILGSTTSGYVNFSPGVNTSGTYSANFGGTGGSAWALGFARAHNWGATFDLTNPNVAKRTQIFGSFLVDSSVSVGATMMGTLDDTTQYTGFTISASSGNLTGTLNIYGYTLS